MLRIVTFLQYLTLRSKKQGKAQPTRKLSGSIDFLNYFKSYKLVGFNCD